LTVEDKRRVGLAFGGGIVRGFAHVGVLSVLYDAGIPIDYIAGTSVGAIVAAVYSAGWTPEQIEAFADKFNWWRVITPVWPSRGLVSFDRMARWFITVAGDLEFSDLKIPCTVVATDIETGQQVNLCTGRVAPAVHASCSLRLRYRGRYFSIFYSTVFRPFGIWDGRDRNDSAAHRRWR